MTMKVDTHLQISKALCGEITALAPDVATAELMTTSEMVVDDHGLVHGGFVFGLADYAAMLAVNDPNVVLGSANVRFVAPVRVGELVRAHAEVEESKGKKRVVAVTARVGEREVFSGSMTAFVLDAHVLEQSEP